MDELKWCFSLFENLIESMACTFILVK